MQEPTLDPTIRPQDDFFSYVNGRWITANPIPDSESRWGTFIVLRDISWKAMHTIYEDLQAQSPTTQSVEQQAKDFYYTGMHYDEFENKHLDEINAMLEMIDEVTSLSDFARVLGTFHAQNVTGFWSLYVDSDHDDATKHIFHIHQDGLTLPDRDYYLEDSDKMKSIRDAFKTHVTKVHTFFPTLAESSEALWTTHSHLETDIAKVSRSAADLRDVENNYHKTKLADLKDTYSNIDWDAYADGLGWQADDKISVDQPEFLEFANKQFTATSLAELKQYLKWHVVDHYLPLVSTKFSELNFEFFGKVLSGTPEMMPQWKRVVLRTEQILGDAVGRLYAEKHFPESSKQQVLDMVEDLRSAYDERIDTLEWLSDEHKTYAKKKLANMKVLIGYPDKWRDFSGLTITRDSYLGNVVAGQKFEHAYWMKRLHEPTSRDEWFMTPQTVNAYHDPNRLVICFPAAILQPPFFDPEASLAANMGGIGTVIGHELTHGFDDQGCQFDANGNVRTWQSPEEREAFNKKAQIIVDQADHFEVLPDLTLRGRLVLGESIADLGGLEISLHALKNRLGGELKSEHITTFFTSYAFTECTSVREEKTREYARIDPHPASEFRVNGIIQHIDDFYTAFDVNEGDKLYRKPEDRAKIW